MKASFEIWLSRDTRLWCHETQGKGDDNILPLPSKIRKHSLVQSRNKNKVPSERCGFVNKGNTCYINALLQSLSVLEHFWRNLYSENQVVAPLASSFLKIMSLLNSSTTPIDPSSFIKCLGRVIRKSGNKTFEMNQQQDVAEALGYVLEELCSCSSKVADSINCRYRTSTVCSTCLEERCEEQTSSTLSVPMADNLQAAVDTFFKPEQVHNATFCCKGSSCQRQTVLSHCSRYLLVQLKRFYVDFQGSVKKDPRQVCFAKDFLSVPASIDNVVSFQQKYQLIATINHSGSLHSGHYTACLPITSSGGWLHCNDKVVSKVQDPLCHGSGAYLFFYELCH